MSRASQATSPILRRFAALSQSFSTSSKPSTPRIRLETKKPISKPPQLIISNQQTMDRRRHRPQIESHAMLGLQVVGTPIQASSSQATPSTSATVSPSVQLDNANAKSKPTPPKTHFQYYYWYEQAPNTRLVYIRDHTQADLELAQLKPGLLGFDLEWKPVFVKGQKENPVALVQLAGEDTILLIQVSAMEQFPTGLRQVLESPQYTKAGVGIEHDCTKLWGDWRVNTRNCVDLSLLARSVDNNRWKGKYGNPIALARLCETYLQRTLNKGKISRSNWEANLALPQQSYAANDAHSGFTLLNHLSTMIGSVSPPPLPAYYTFDLMFGYLYHTSTAQPTRLWQAHNPNYDPGPPPVKVIKPAKEKTENRQTDTPADTQHLATGHNQEVTNRPTKSKHWRKNRGRGGSVRTHPPSTRTDTGPHATHLYS